MPENRQERRSGHERQRQGVQARERARRERRRWLIIFAGTVIVVILGIVAFVVINRRDNSPTIAGVESFSGLARNHTSSPVTYPQMPPVGGPHNPMWQNCGYYSAPIMNENGVHSLEHGAVWITYRPDLPADQIAALRKLAGQTYVLVTPYPGLPAPVVASAWGKQLKLDSPDDPRLNQFIQAYRQGPQTPEQGSPCTGGVGAPQ